jgi:myo-inositol-1-phosphate synthase
LGRPQHLRQSKRHGPGRSDQQGIQARTKDRVVTQFLGYKPSTLVTIEYIPDMGDWKTAWDYIRFHGFLGSEMALQFTRQRCDRLLAVPLAIELARLADLKNAAEGVGS